MTRHCVVIPVFDNAATVATVALAAARRVELVIVVDDGSTDGTYDAAMEAAFRAAAAAPRLGWIDVVRLPRNRGKGAALVAGFRRADELHFTHAVTVDADGQHRAADIPKLVALSAAHPETIVVGARDMDADRIPTAARVGRDVSNFWTKRTTGFELPDTTCGLRAYPVREVLALAIRTRRYDYEGEVLVRGAWAGLALAPAPIDVWYPESRSDRVTHYRPWADSVRITRMYVRLGLLRLVPGARTASPAFVAPPARRGFRARLRAVAASGAATNELALVLGVGVFLGATPLWGLHAALAAYVAVRWRLNVIAALLATSVSCPLVAPALVFAEIQLGHLLRSGSWLALRRDEFAWHDAWSYLGDYLVGGFALAALLGIATGLATLVIGSALTRRRARARPVEAPVEAAVT